MAGTPQAFQSNAFQNDAFQTGVPAVVVTTTPVSYGGGDDDLTLRVRAHWDRIERGRSALAERQAAEKERQRAIEARRQNLAELEAKRAKKRKAVQRETERAAILADIALFESQAQSLREQIEAAMNLIAAEQMAIQQLMRRRALLLVALAS